MKKVEKQYRPIALDLFAGCGGFSLGAEAAGFNIAASVEIDPIHALTHHFNFPYGATICKDIRNVSRSLIEEKLRINGFDTEIDLIIGGSPCQGFSLMGKRDDHDIRNQLIYEYARIVNEFKPKYFLFENVPGIINGDTKRVFEDFLKQFPDYRLEWKILSGVQFNLPQNRKRVIALGSRKDVRCVSLPQGNPFDKYLQKQTTSKDAIGDLALVSPYIAKDEGIVLEEILRVRTKVSSEYLLLLDNFFELCHLRHGKKLIWGT
jgi:DNA (cytosine-5)-methyltransferase 1